MDDCPHCAHGLWSLLAPIVDGIAPLPSATAPPTVGGKRKRAQKRKEGNSEARANHSASQSEEHENHMSTATAEPKRKVGRPKKVANETNAPATAAATPPPTVPKRGPGRPRKMNDTSTKKKSTATIKTAKTPTLAKSVTMAKPNNILINEVTPLLAQGYPVFLTAGGALILPK